MGERAEWLQAATTAIVGEVRLARLWDCVPFPTRSEVWLVAGGLEKGLIAWAALQDLATAAARSGETAAGMPG